MSIVEVILCNDAKPSKGFYRKIPEREIVSLNYDKNDKDTLVNVQLPEFVLDLYHIPDRIKDLLEIAAFVYAADRYIKRGSIKDVEYQSWSRSFHFVIRVRDIAFWNKPSVKVSLAELLSFMTGDKDFKFTFQGNRTTGPTSLFDKPEFKISRNKPTKVILFSGGLDSLVGIVENLVNCQDELCLVSHASHHPIVGSTQNNIIGILNNDFPNRCKHYKFRCNLRRARAVEETQRSRFFLYASIAFALAHAYNLGSFYFYENGIMSFNFPLRTDLLNGRASRTTHPKSIKLLERFLGLFKSGFTIINPFLFKTKRDIITMLMNFGKTDYFRSTVSCSSTFQRSGSSTHCGECSQCIDRKFAIYAANADSFDDDLGLYSKDFIREKIKNLQVRGFIIDYVRLARNFSTMNVDNFAYEKLNELSEIIDFVDGISDEEKTGKIFDVCHSHGVQIEEALVNMKAKYEKPFKKDAVIDGSLLSLIAHGVHFTSPVQSLAKTIAQKLSTSIPIIFQKNKPKDENDFNDKVEGLINVERSDYEREFPSICFGLVKTIPDHSFNRTDLIIESKYVRDSTTPSKVSDAIAADLTKYPKGSLKLFIVYDPHRKITNDGKFKNTFQSKNNCIVCIIR
jgi:hypothetical protein